MQHSNRQRFSKQYKKTTLVIKEKKNYTLDFSENMLTKRQCYKNEKAIHRLGEKIQDLHLYQGSSTKGT